MHQPQQHITDSSLMQEISNGSKIALELLYQRYAKKLWLFAFQFVRNKEEAEDIVQEVFLKIIKQPQSFKSEYNFSTWIYTITANLAKNNIRNNSKVSVVSVEKIAEAMVLQTNEIDAKKINYAITNFLEKCTEKEQKIYTLRFEQNLKIEEIASIMNLPEGSIKSGIYYLLKKLKIELELKLEVKVK